MVKKLRDKKTTIIVVVFLIALSATLAILLYVRFYSVKDPEITAGPALQIGETKLTKERYNMLVKQAKDQSLDEPMAKNTLQESIRSREIARQLKVTVPEYLVAAQNQPIEDGVYIPYQNLSEFQKENLYPKALNVVLSLIENGGSVNSVLYAAYDASQNTEVNRKYAEDMVNGVTNFKKNSINEQGKKIDNPFPLLLADFTTDQQGNFAPKINKSGLIALTDNGRQLYGIDEFTAENNGVTNSAYDTNLFGIIQPLKKGELSSAVKLQGRDAYTIIYKHDTYAKDSGIRTRYLHVAQGLER